MSHSVCITPVAHVHVFIPFSYHRKYARARKKMGTLGRGQQIILEVCIYSRYTPR